MPNNPTNSDPRCANPGRRELLTKGVPALTALAVTAVGGAYDTGQPKVSKAAAQYREAPNGQQACANCRNYIAANSTCRVVEGPVSPNAWSRYWAPRVA